MTITSVAAMMSFADLGIGAGLLTSLSQANGTGDRETAQKYVSSAFFVLLGTACFLLGVVGLFRSLIPWPRVFNVTSALAAREAGPAVFIFLTCFISNIPLDIVQRTQTGYQEGFETNLWMMAGSLVGFSCLLTAMHFKAGLPWLVLAMSGGPVIVLLGNWAHEFGWVRPWLLPRWAYWDPVAARKLLGTGTMFLIMQVCAVFSVSIDNIIITQALGPEAVTQFAVPIRMFLLVRSVGGMFVFPLWPAYSEALTRGDISWVKKTVLRSVALSFACFGPLAFSLAVFGKGLVHVWVGPQIQPTYGLLAGAALWVVVDLCGQAMTVFLCGANLMKFQVFLFVGSALANLPGKLIGVRLFGLSGVVWTTALSTVIGTLAVALYTYSALAKLANKSQARV
jgi:O-antigen/teichoic acid export membrane protein